MYLTKSLATIKRKNKYYLVALDALGCKLVLVTFGTIDVVLLRDE